MPTSLAPKATPKISTGVDGLDQILGGGLPTNRLFLLEGTPGTGKTTFALRFLQAGVAAGDRTLYVTLSETANELEAVTASHGWSLEGITVFELVDEMGTSPEVEQSILHPSEIELGETIGKITGQIEELQPTRVVIDSLSEMRLLAQDPLRYRRQVLALKQFFASRACTVLLLDDKTSEPGDLQLHSISHGVISLEQAVQEYGTETRRLRVVKMRGQKFQGGRHDFVLDTGKVEVFPRLIAAQHRQDIVHDVVSTGTPALDAMLGGGLNRGTSLLLLGPSGAGKTSTAVSCMFAALKRGERATYYLFDEGLATLLLRSRSLGMDLSPFIESGHCEMVQIDPADLSTGAFSAMVVDAVRNRGMGFLAIDSLNAYLQAMPGQSYLLLHMHELLSFLNQRDVVTLLVVSQHGTVSNVRSEIDLSYLSDSSLLYRYFEAEGSVRTAITAMKSRTAQNERSIREFRLTSESGLQVGEPLVAFEGVMSGLPRYEGKTQMIADDAAG